MYKGAWTLLSHRHARKVTHIGHNSHLCEIVKRDELTLKQMKSLIGDATFICTRCGRAAANEANLCEPTPLY
jgi:hypothetical protein